MTEFSIPAGKVYLSPMFDCYDGMPVAWNISRKPDAQLVNPAGSSKYAEPGWSGQCLKRDILQTIQPVKDF